MNRRDSLLLLASAMGIARVGAKAAAPVFERALMGTRFAIQCYHEDADLVAVATKAAFAMGDEINAVASDYIADSELLALPKHPAGAPVPISPLLFGLLKEARFYAEQTAGIFDPTIGPYTRLWRESRRRKALPDPAMLEKARASVGWQKMILDAEKLTATFLVRDMRLDLGGIAKGQAAERMFQILKQHGISSCSVTAGGDVRLGDPPPDQHGWSIGVRTFDKLHDTQVLILSNCAVSTSGDLQQAVEIDGVRYSHIIDPATGMGVTNHVSATVVAGNAAMSDALDSTCCIVEPGLARKIAAGFGAKVYLSVAVD